MSYCLPNGTWSINNFTCKAVESCKEVFSCNPDARDGHFIIYPKLTNRQPVKVFCHNITSSPVEYITLYELNIAVENASVLTGVCTWKDKLGDRTITFRKLRINVTSMLIKTNDFTFADETKESKHWINSYWIQPTFGFAADCSSDSTACPKLGYFIINLKGTGLRLDPKLQWRGSGFKPTANWFNNGTYAEGRCGGYCGRCRPARPMQLFIDATQNFDTASRQPVINCRP